MQAQTQTFLFCVEPFDNKLQVKWHAILSSLAGNF